jgi:hypothetical protein
MDLDRQKSPRSDSSVRREDSRHYGVSEDLFLKVASQTAFSSALSGLFGASRQPAATIR